MFRRIANIISNYHSLSILFSTPIFFHENETYYECFMP